VIRVWSILIAALALRGAVAVFTERHPIFPPYYYIDAKLAEATASDMADAWSTGRAYAIPANPSERAHAGVLAAVYSVTGKKPVAGKLMNAALGSTSALLLGAAAFPSFGPMAATLSAIAVALWPSHIFNTSQNFKDALAIFLSWLAFALIFRVQTESWKGRRRAVAGLGFAALSLILLGFIRAYVLAVSSLAILIGAGFHAYRHPGKQRAFACGSAIAAVTAVLVYRLVSATLFPPSPIANSGRAHSEDSMLADTLDETGRNIINPWSPQGLTRIRRIRQASDQYWAQTHGGRRIATQIFPEARFSSWLDVAFFIPRSASYVLFMPLPGLYPTDGRVGRLFASLENVCLVIIALFALLCLAGQRQWDGPRVALLAFFLMMTAGSSLLEFDLGSATRHKLNYLPALFPFAFEYVLSRRKAREGRLKVLQVLECGGPGGTGNQVAALCNALPHDRFDVQLVYNVRPGCDADEFRKSAQGAAQAFRIDTLTREISPLRDARALWSLYRLFKREQPDVVHLHSSKAGALGRPAAWLAGVPRIFYTPHGYGFLQADRGGLSRALYKLAELSVSWIGTVVAVSPSEAALAKPLAWGNRVETVCDPYLGALPPSNHTQPRKETWVGACGRLTAARQPNVFVNLSQRLTDSRNGLKCVWIGGGELEGRVKSDLENMNLLSKVEVTGWLPGADAQERLGDLDVLVHYSRWDGLPNAVLEAMAHGIPVVASDVPGCRDAVVDGETGFLAATEKDLLEKTLRLVDDPALRRKLGEAGRRRVQDCFDQKAALARLEALYQGHAG